MLLISSCLVGINCRYNGTSTIDCELKKMVENGITADLLNKNGIEILNEKNWRQAEK